MTNASFLIQSPRTLTKIVEGINALDMNNRDTMGDVYEAETPLNIVRKRAGLADVKGLSQDAMREKIIHERRMELAFEGHRWFDMIRIQGGEYAVNFLHSIGKTNANLNRLIFPIPQTERDANPLIDQNPGY